MRKILEAAVYGGLQNLFFGVGQRYSKRLSARFYRATRMHSADNAVARCPYVRLSHAGILSKRLHISSKFFHHALPF